MSETLSNDLEIVWGVLSGDDLSGASIATLDTMNDIELIHWIDSDTYSVDIEAIYEFKTKADERAYLYGLLEQFTDWMKEQGRSTEVPLRMDQFFSAANNGRYESIEEAYTAYRMMVEGYAGPVSKRDHLNMSNHDRQVAARSLFGILPPDPKA